MTKLDVPSNVDIQYNKVELGDSNFDQHFYKTRYKDMIIHTSVNQKRNLPQSAHVEFSVNGSTDNTLFKNSAVDAAKVLNIVSSHLQQHLKNNSSVEGYTYSTDNETKDRIYKKMGKINNFPVKRIIPKNNNNKNTFKG